MSILTKSIQEPYDEDSILVNAISQQLGKLNEKYLKNYKSKWRLFFSSFPDKIQLEHLVNGLTNINVSQINEDIGLKELQLLQYLLISLHAPSNLQLPNEKWNYVADLMPTKRPVEEYKRLSQEFYHPSAYLNPWTEEEDSLLLNIISQHQLLNKGNKWSQISKQLSEKSNFKFIRTPKQCRERWGNKLDPTISRDEWSLEEDLQFLKLLLTNGRRWADLTGKLSQLTTNKKRTEFALKHRFRKLLTKQSPIQSTFRRENVKLSLEVSPDWNPKEISLLKSRIGILSSQIHKSSLYQLNVLKKTKLEQSQSKILIFKGNKIQTLDFSIFLNNILQQ